LASAKSFKTNIKFDNVTAAYNKSRPVFTGMNLEISEPGIFHLVGANGSGKSTVTELASGYLIPLHGKVTISGLDARSAETRFMRNICRTEISLYPHITVRDHLILAGNATNVSKNYALDRAEFYGLGQWLNAFAGSISTGNMRKLWTIICTLPDVPVVVLDEPYLGLDDVGRKILNSEISRWSQKSLVILISHADFSELVITETINLADCCRKAKDPGF